MKNKIAVVGCGRWGKNLVRVFNELGALYAICDIDDKLVSNLIKTSVEKNKGETFLGYTDYRHILENREVDAVAIATPSNTHFEMAKKALQNGIDVFVEKPMALTFEEGKQLVSLAEETESILMAGHILEYHLAVIKLKKLIDAGELGKIRYIYSNRLNLGTVRTEENVISSFAPHDISAILYLLGKTPSMVAATGGSYLDPSLEDVTIAYMKFPGGVKSHIFVSWIHPYKEQKIIVIGDKKMAVFDDLRAPAQKLSIQAYDDKPPISVRYRWIEPLKIECKHFIDCLNTREEPKTSGRRALRVLQVLDLFQESLRDDGTDTDKFLMPPQEEVRLRNLQTPFVHESSYVDEDVKIGEGTKIWHFCHIQSGARIGKNCTIGQNVNIGPGVSIGDNVKIQNNVSVYEGVTIKDNVFIGPSVVFTNVKHPISYSPAKQFLHTLIETGASIGANATILCGIRIGDYSMIGAGSVVTKDVRNSATVYGVPAKEKK